MTSGSLPATVCLDVAIDHRIRRLFRPVPRPNYNAPPGDHVSLLESYGRSLGLRNDEIRVTGDLASPASKGGIAVVLQQPRDDHPFEQGTRAVIEDCETLTTIKQLFAVVSCGSLNIQRDISLIDLLPYTSEIEMRRMDEASLRDAFRETVQILCEKEPDVVLCAGQIRLRPPPGSRRGQIGEGERDDRKGEAWKLECRGVGRSFGKYTIVRIKGEDRGLVKLHRVNGFHPSHAVNYHPTYSCLRQLLFLEVAQTCGAYRGDWEEEAWYDLLRASCTEQSRKLSNVSNPGGSSITGSPQTPKFLPHYAERYLEILATIRSTIATIASPEDNGSSSRSTEVYEGLLESELSKHCNDASLALRKLFDVKNKGWPERFDKWNRGLLQRAAMKTLELTAQRWDQRGWFESRRVRQTIMTCLAKIDACIVGSSKQSLELDLIPASDAFLDTAEAVEVILWDLSMDDEQRILSREPNAAGLDSLANTLGGMTLATRARSNR